VSVYSFEQENMKFVRVSVYGALLRECIQGSFE